MSRRQWRPKTIAEARAQLDQHDVNAVRKWRGSRADFIEMDFNCIVCGTEAKAHVNRLDIAEIEGAKHLCEECCGFGWAWMGNLVGAGTIEEQGNISTVEREALRQEHGDANLVSRTLFKTQRTMKSSTQNPMQEYKPVRVFPDDTLVLHLRKCKNPGSPEQEDWTLWIDQP